MIFTAQLASLLKDIQKSTNSFLTGALIMAVQFQEETGQYLLRIGDTVLLYAKEARGYAFSKLTRYVSVACQIEQIQLVASLVHVPLRQYHLDLCTLN